MVPVVRFQKRVRLAASPSLVVITKARRPSAAAVTTGKNPDLQRVSRREEGPEIGNSILPSVSGFRGNLSGLPLLLTRIFAMPARDSPFRVLDGPLCHGRLSLHGAFLERGTRIDDNALILAHIGIRERADGENNFQKFQFALLRRNSSR